MSSVLVALGAVDCSSSAPPPVLCSIPSGDVSHRSVTAGASKLELDVSSSSSALHLVVDGLRALDVTAVLTAQGWMETATQGPAYANQARHVTHLIRTGGQITGDVDGKPLAPFSKDAGAGTVHFADGTPFVPGVAPSSQHILDTYRRLSESLTSGSCVETGSVSALSTPAVPQSPQSEAPCTLCHGNCTITSVGLVTGGTATCAAIFDGAFFGIPLGICVLGVVAGAAIYDGVCIAGCDAVGGSCCPHTCDNAMDNEFCCEQDSTCSSPAHHLCCANTTTPCNENCCDKVAETCTSQTDSTCCPNAQACGGATDGCCPAGEGCVGGTSCCNTQDICHTPNGLATCCTGGSVCNPVDGTCACPPNSSSCGGQCCGQGSVCAPASQTCCNVGAGQNLCGGQCCDGPCMTQPTAPGCCPPSCVVNGQCCMSGQSCVSGQCQ